MSGSDFLALTQINLAAVHGVDVRTLRRWDADGHPRNPDGTYSAPASIEWRIAKERDHGLNLDHERARLAAAQADRIEIELREKERELVYTWQIADYVGALLANCRAHFLAIPSRLGSLYGAAVAGAAETLVHEALHTLADGGGLDQFRPVDDGERVIFDATKRRWRFNGGVVALCPSCGLPTEQPIGAPADGGSDAPPSTGRRRRRQKERQE